VSDDTRDVVHGPYETSAQADADAAHVYQSVRGHRYASAETIQLSGLHSIAAVPVADRINEGLLLAALDAAGVQLGAHDRRVVGWLAAWEPSIVQVVIGWVERARGAAPVHGLIADLAVPAPSLCGATQGPGSFTPRFITCPECLTLLAARAGGADGAVA
jgi:hypothetical protein